MNIRTFYHSLLWLSAACIAALGFLLIQSHQEAKIATRELRAEQALNVRLVSQSPEEIVRKARVLVAERTKGTDSSHTSYQVIYLDKGWAVLVSKDKDKSFTTPLVDMQFDGSAKLISYHQYTPH